MACPSCGGQIPLEDVNVQEAVALCRACGAVTRLSYWAQDPSLAGVDLENPPKGCRLVTDGAASLVTADARWPSMALGKLLTAVAFGTAVFFSAAAAVVCTRQLIQGTGGRFAPTLTGAITFWLLLALSLSLFILVLASALVALAGRVEVRVQGPLGEVFTGIGPWGWLRRFDATAVRSVRLEVRPNSKGGHWTVIEIAGTRRLRFGSGLPPERQAWMAAALGNVLRDDSD